MSAARDIVLAAHQVHCQHAGQAARADALEFARGSFHVLRGGADSGHELLLRALGLLEPLESGEIFIEGRPTRGLGEDERLRLRERRLGFVFTAPFLLPAFNVIENIAMPLFKISEVDPAEARLRSELLLKFTALTELSDEPCANLSPLQQHRVALARALANEPALVLVENIDTALADEDLRAFTGLLRLAANHLGVAIIATTTRAFPSLRVDRVIDVVDGLAVVSEFLPRAEE